MKENRNVINYHVSSLSILMCIDSHVISYQDTNVLLILMWPYSSILMCYWLACDLIPAFWCVIASDVASSQHTNVLLIIMWPHSSILMWPNSSILKYYWFLWYLNPGTDVLLILMWPLSSMLMCYWLSCDLIPANWCVIDSHVTSFQHTDVLLILMWPHSSILICYWFSCRVASRNLHLWALCLIT